MTTPVDQISRSQEIPRERLMPGAFFLLLGILTLPVFGLGVLFLKGLVLVNPNQSAVLLLFGRYKGTVRKPGMYFVNPLISKKKVSLRIHNFNSQTLKVNDLRGNPVEIGAVVVWRVNDTAQACFDVEDYVHYVEIQSEASLRTTASLHPYDSAKAGETSLRGDSAEVNDELERQLTERLGAAGIEVLEVRISHLAYAPEIAGAMLRRQQAEAVIDARSRIVEGAVGMVEQALEQLAGGPMIQLDNTQRVQLASNLLVVLCSEAEATPIINTTGAAPQTSAST